VTHLRSGDWQVCNVRDHAECVGFMRRWHYSQGASKVAVARHGLYPAGLFGELSGVALWLPPIVAAARKVGGDDWRGVLSLTRLAVLPGMPTNAASFLLGRSMQLIDRERWPILLTFADTRLGHTGAIYKATNWRCDGPVAAGATWMMPDGTQVGSKRGARNLTVAEMQRMGAVHLGDSPKIRFVHDVRKPRRHGPDAVQLERPTEMVDKLLRLWDDA
jgi:hypothetical protein